MSECAPINRSFNQTTHPEYNNACVLGDPSLLSNEPLEKILSDCCQDPNGTNGTDANFSADSCYFICSFDQVSQFILYPLCLSQNRNATIPGLPGGLLSIPGNCFGDLLDDYNNNNIPGLVNSTSSDTLMSTSSSPARLTTLTGTAVKTSATVASTSSSPSSVTPTGSAASASATTKPSKASSGGSISIGAVVIVGLVFFGLFV